jgi:UDPglucose 6-dehydrogenase
MSEFSEKTGQMLPRLQELLVLDIVSIKILKASVGFEDRVFRKDIKSCLYFKIIWFNEVADWEQVIIMNDHQKRRFARNIVCTNTVADKKSHSLFSFKRHQRYQRICRHLCC